MTRPCTCGSGRPRHELRDARGIFCAYVCTKCEAEKRACYLTEIFDDPAYEADEAIEED